MTVHATLSRHKKLRFCDWGYADDRLSPDEEARVRSVDLGFRPLTCPARANGSRRQHPHAGVSGENSVTRNERHVFQNRLRYHHAIEGVAVVPRQRRRRQGLLQ